MEDANSAARVVKSGVRAGISAFFEYDTPKIVHIKSKKVGVINRIIQLGIIGYIIGFAIIYKKGYQDFDIIESAATTKVKGVIYSNFTDKSKENEILNKRIWDVADYIVPPQELDAFFVTTNLVVTPGQNQTKCDEDPGLGTCQEDADCHEGASGIESNGVQTGKCIDSKRQSGTKVCEIYAWCPVENDAHLLKPGLLSQSEKFTVLIKNNIEFPRFQVKRRNIINSINNETYLKSCKYNSSDPIDRFCPIFELGVIIKEAGENYTEIAYKGGIIAISITWDCNLDLDITECRPEYKFRRLDDKNAAIAKGWNFRYANFYYEDGVQRRDIFKAYGIRFVIKVTGQAGKFNVVPLFMNIGSGVGLLAIATVLCDTIMIYLLKNGVFYQRKKYLFVEDDDAFKGDFLSSDNQAGAATSDPEQPQNRQDMLLKAQNQNPNYDTIGNTAHIQSGGDQNEVKNRKNSNSKPGEYSRLEED